jgi:hypothetical protein
VVILGLVGGPATRAVAQGYGATLQQLLSRVTALESSAQNQGVRLQSLESKTQYLSVSGTEVYLTGANLHVVNGMGGTETTNGLGNLIVGYDELRFGVLGNRSGSHNIVTGILNDYSSFGGIIGGYANSLSGGEAFCVGTQNTASGTQACVSGGALSSATAPYSSVSGGQSNTASAYYSSVTGGVSNTASGLFASVSGGQNNLASEQSSSVGGGNARQTAAGVIAGWAAGSQAAGGLTPGNFSSPLVRQHTPPPIDVIEAKRGITFEARAPRR